MDLLQKVDGNQSRAHEWKSQRSVIDGGNNLKMVNLKALIYGFGKIILLINIEHALTHSQSVFLSTSVKLFARGEEGTSPNLKNIFLVENKIFFVTPLDLRPTHSN